MTRVVITSVFALMGFAHVSCVEQATQEESKAMCETLVRLRGKIETLNEEELLAKVEEDFNKEEVRLRAWMDRDLKAWDDEFDVKLAEAKTDEEKATLKADYEKRTEVARQKHTPGIEQLRPKKEAAKKEAKQKAEDAMSEWSASVDECLTGALKEGTPKKVAECRIKAESTDQYWNVCR